MSEERERSRDRSRRDRPSRFSESNRDRSMDRGRDRGGAKSSMNRVYVSNIPYEYRWQDIKDLFREQVGDVAFVEMFVDDNDKPRGCGIVEFSDASSVKKCIELMQRYEVKGRKLVIKEDSGNMRDSYGNLIGGNKRSRIDDRYRDDRESRNSGAGNALRQDDSKWGNTYGLSTHFLESLHIDAPLCNRVFVANLEYNVDKKKLKEVFRLAGRVVRVDLPIDKDGRSRGFAVVEYDHPVEAVQAISMLHNQVLYDRTMTVRMDRANENVKLPEGLKSVGMGLGQGGEPLRNVVHNLPSGGLGAQTGPGILGTVPNNALSVASALSGLNNVSALGNLNPSVLGAANLSGLTSNFLQNGLGGNTDLQTLMGSNSGMMSHQNQNQPMSGMQRSNNMGGGTGGMNMGSSGTGGGGQGGYGRGNDGYDMNAPVTYPTNYGSTGRGNSNQQGYGAANNMMKSNPDNKGFSRKVLVSNLPPSASFKLLQEKLNEFGEISYWEEKSAGSFLIVYANEWQAERAIKNLDKARINGRFIEARTYY
ncbi:heterogeneous nuclear ribonucleoprotein rumpelstiltskin isoform X2 [Rhynchophorus ferrugineus]|uniref:heterogeneous nuclear ribonucleoprotein rumpelstiltskin isoform X2 n=1 Tax=Rhynchophorus ferrugineus TaxID=354439 RepID=UPI003FCCBA4B